MAVPATHPEVVGVVAVPAVEEVVDLDRVLAEDEAPRRLTGALRGALDVDAHPDRLAPVARRRQDGLISDAMRELDGTIAFVTGAGSGLGREIALTFARAGAHIAVNDLRPDAARAVQKELAALEAAVACGPL